jgi:hypothetical protein
MPRLTLLDLAKLNADDLRRGIIEEAIAIAPELRVATARLIPGTEYRSVVRTGLPSTGFREGNTGVDASKSTFENRLCQCFILAGRIECDQAIADGYVDGPDAYQALEAVGVLEAAYRKAGAQFYYGTDNDALGFPGLIAAYDADNMTVDAGGVGADRTSVWFVKFGERDVQFVLGENTVLKLGEFRVESLEDENGKKFPGYVGDMSTWIGLQVVNRHSAVRIKNMSTATGKGMTDDLAFEALAKFPAGVAPSFCFMNRRSLEQLRRSRTKVTSPTGVPTLPDSVAGIPIVVTDSIVNAEA